MTLQEAKQIIVRFKKGQLPPEDHRALVLFLKYDAADDQIRSIDNYSEFLDIHFDNAEYIPEWYQVLNLRLERSGDKEETYEGQEEVRKSRKARPLRVAGYYAAGITGLVLLCFAGYWGRNYFYPDLPKSITAATVNGQQKHVILPDGSEVWLNNASSITYSSRFAQKERNINLIGEAYFEIAPNPSAPFKVKTGASLVEVLGTKFDVKDYPDDSSMMVSVSEGAVKVSNEKEEAILHREEFAIIKHTIFLSHNGNIESTFAWREGRLVFSNQELRTVMKSVERQYGMTVRYEEGAPVSKKVSGALLNIWTPEEIAEQLQIQGIHCQLNNMTLTIKP